VNACIGLYVSFNLIQMYIAEANNFLLFLAMKLFITLFIVTLCNFLLTFG